MELKSKGKKQQNKDNMGSNRTFMELKSSSMVRSSSVFVF